MRRASPADLSPKLEAVRTIAELGEGRLDAADVAAASALARRVDERLGLAGATTVAALAGATGSGKSSLFNALAGSPISAVGVRRPTTAQTTAAVWGDGSTDAVLDRLGVEHRHRVEQADLEGLVLLDLPDHDSTEAAHRHEVDRLVELVDFFVWVVDPQKYADALLHDAYLRPLARHARVTVVVLNHVDRLDSPDRDRCIGDLRGLLARDGLGNVSVLATSAVTGAGIDELRDLLEKKVEAKDAAVQRLAADITGLAEGFARYCGPKEPARVSDRQLDQVADSIARAAGGETVAEAARRSYRREAGLATGWTVTRWIRRFKPDRLARLHLGGDRAGRTSVRSAGPIERARVETAVRNVAAQSATGLPEPWPSVVRARATSSVPELLQEMDRALGRADVQRPRRPRWWTAGSLLQNLFLIAAVAGFVWLGVLFALAWFQIPEPPTPQVRDVPWPTLLFFGGLLCGFLSSAIAGVFARVGASRAHRRARRSIEAEMGAVAERCVVDPIDAELDAYRQLCRAVSLVRS